MSNPEPSGQDTDSQDTKEEVFICGESSDSDVVYIQQIEGNTSSTQEAAAGETESEPSERSQSNVTSEEPSVEEPVAGPSLPRAQQSSSQESSGDQRVTLHPVSSVPVERAVGSPLGYGSSQGSGASLHSADENSYVHIGTFPGQFPESHITFDQQFALQEGFQEQAQLAASQQPGSFQSSISARVVQRLQLAQLPQPAQSSQPAQLPQPSAPEESPTLAGVCTSFEESVIMPPPEPDFEVLKVGQSDKSSTRKSDPLARKRKMDKDDKDDDDQEPLPKEGKDPPPSPPSAGPSTAS